MTRAERQARHARERQYRSIQLTIALLRAARARNASADVLGELARKLCAQLRARHSLSPLAAS